MAEVMVFEVSSRKESALLPVKESCFIEQQISKTELSLEGMLLLPKRYGEGVKDGPAAFCRSPP